jgi:methyl coenzyme M reductase subunit D
MGGKMENENTKVSVALGYTLNLGNFESLRVDLGITDYVRQGENVKQAQDRVYKTVETQLIEKVNEAKAQLASK